MTEQPDDEDRSLWGNQPQPAGRAQNQEHDQQPSPGDVDQPDEEDSDDGQSER